MPGLTFGDLNRLLEIFGFVAGKPKSGNVELHHPNRPHTVVRLNEDLDSPATQAAMEEVVSTILVNARLQSAAPPAVTPPPSRSHRLPGGTLPAALWLSGTIFLGVRMHYEHREPLPPPPPALVPEGPKAAPKGPRPPCPMAKKPQKKSGPQPQEAVPTNTTKFDISIQAGKLTEAEVAEREKGLRRTLENEGCPGVGPRQGSSSHN